jgi:hypothetical protein
MRVPLHAHLGREFRFQFHVLGADEAGFLDRDRSGFSM